MYLIVFSTPHRYSSFLILPHHAHASLEVDLHDMGAGEIGREVVTGRAHSWTKSSKNSIVSSE